MELQRNWYAVKVFFNKVFALEGKLQARGLETFLAVNKLQLKGEEYLRAQRRMALDTNPLEVLYVREGPVIYRRVPLVNSLLFVKATEEEICEVEALLKEPLSYGGSLMGFIYKNAERKEFAIIPPAQMDIFRMVVESAPGGAKVFTPDDIGRFGLGEKVRVKEGPLKGAEGYIKRIRRDRKLLVCIEGVIAVASSYIPPQFLEKTDSQ